MEPQALRQLLAIFPVASMREQWETTGRTKADVIDKVTATTLPENLIEYVYSNCGLTKQHVYLFSHSARQLNKLPDSVLSDLAPQKTKSESGQKEFFYLIPLKFNFVAGDPPVSGSLTFPWPVRFVFRPALLAAYLTTMEKDISAHVDQEPVHRSYRSLQNEQLLQDVIETLPSAYGLTRLDINKGVKHLWDAGKIDATKASWKQSRSTHTDSMDEDFFLKKHAPSSYREACRAPLYKAVFKLLDPSLPWPDSMMIDATSGEIGISRFGKDRQAVDNVVGEILRHN